ncbi:unnamed protein product, partial [Rotaria sordida]
KCEFLIKKAEEGPKIIKNEIAYICHLDKIFDEILDINQQVFFFKQNKTLLYNSQLTKILGLNYGEKYANKNGLLKLHDEKLIIMTDQDQDGSHIKDLLINFIHYK